MDDSAPLDEAQNSVRSDDGLLAGRYRLAGLLGRGGMADVYRARDERLDRDVAVKLFRAGSALAEHAARWRGEVRLLAGLSHPGLVAVFDASGDEPEDARSYLVMEFVAGVSLAERLRRGPLSPGEAAAIGTQLATTLVYVHGRGVVHRDIKPANVLLTNEGGAAVKLADFGIARLLDDTRVTAIGTTVGTANYLSPEQATGVEVGPASDIYSFGLVLLECLTGQVAYPGHGLGAAAARLHRPPEIPAELGVDWVRLLTAMTAADPASRPSAAEVATALDSLAASPPDAATPVAATAALTAPPTRTRPVQGKRRRRAVLIAAAALAAAFVAAAIALAVRDRQTPIAGSALTPTTAATRASSSPAHPSSTQHSTARPRITTVAQALTALRAAIAHAVNTGNLDLAAATDLDNRLTDISQSLHNPADHDRHKATGDLQHKVGDLGKRISDLTESGQLTSAGRQQLAGPLAALERLIPPNS